VSQLVAVLFEHVEKILPERYRIQLVACSAFFGLLLWVALATGKFPGVFAGFARATDFDTFWEEQLNVNIIDLRERQCAATGEAKRAFWDEISTDIAQWQTLTHKQTYPLPNCSDM
jgi:hypothetical protein